MKATYRKTICTNIGQTCERCCHNPVIRRGDPGTALVVQWLGLCACTAEGAGSISGQGTKTLQAAKLKKKKEEATPRYVAKSCRKSCYEGVWQG